MPYFCRHPKQKINLNFNHYNKGDIPKTQLNRVGKQNFNTSIMKNLLLTLFICAVGAQVSFSQGTHVPPIDPCTPDLYIHNVGTWPATANAGQTISFPVTIKNAVECGTASFVLRLQVEVGPFIFDYLDVTVTGFSSVEDTRVVYVNYVVPSYLAGSGSPIYLASLWVDFNNDVSESDETNNYYTPPTTSGYSTIIN